MPVQIKTKTVKIGNSLRSTIPKPIADGYEITPGTILIWKDTDGQITVTPQPKEKNKK